RDPRPTGLGAHRGARRAGTGLRGGRDRQQPALRRRRRAGADPHLGGAPGRRPHGLGGDRSGPAPREARLRPCPHRTGDRRGLPLRPPGAGADLDRPLAVAASGGVGGRRSSGRGVQHQLRRAARPDRRDPGRRRARTPTQRRADPVSPTPDDVRVRPAVPADAADIAHVHVTTWQQAYDGILPVELLDTLSVELRTRRWAEFLDAVPDRNSLLLARVGDRTVGFVGVCPSRDADVEPGTGEVAAIYLLRPWWDRGIGATLLDAAEAA